MKTRYVRVDIVAALTGDKSQSDDMLVARDPANLDDVNQTLRMTVNCVEQCMLQNELTASGCLSPFSRNAGQVL